jgi:glycosyltransferase involved in cell wall biosynthesis
VRRCLREFVAESIDVVLIDHESTDDTVTKARAFLGRGLLAIETLPWRGRFSLSEQLDRKAAIAAAAPHDWIIHADADERFEPPAGFFAMREALGAVQAAGYNCVNFSEFVFAALRDEDFTFEGYEDAMRTYYFFEPLRPYFMRAWRRELAAHLPERAGHVIQGPDVRLSPTDFVLRHFVALSERQVVEKYRGRSFSKEDLARGWHGDRFGFSSASYRLEPRSELRKLASPYSREYDVSAPQRTHYWEWPAASESDAVSWPRRAAIPSPKRRPPKRSTGSRGRG